MRWSEGLAASIQSDGPEQMNCSLSPITAPLTLPSIAAAITAARGTRRSRAARPTRSIPAPASRSARSPMRGAADVDAAVAAAKAAFKEWRNVPPLERAKMLRRIAEVLREHARGAGDDRRRRLRQSGARDGERRDGGGGADRVLRRARHRDEGLVDPDGAGRGELLGARAARRRRRASSRSIIRSCSAWASRRRRSRPATPWS